MRKSILGLAAGLLLSGAGLATLHAQAPNSQTTTTTTTRDVQAPVASETTTVQTTTQQGNTSQTFMGKIDKKDDQFILQNKDAKSSYKLDDASKADHFNGDEVKVTGTLDSATNMIHVQTIEKVHD